MTTLREAVQEFVADYDCGGCGHFAAYAERFRAALAQPEARNQCGETCERAKLCAVCARELEGTAQPPCDIAEDGVCEALDCCRKLPLILEALEIGYDSAQAEAAQYHAAMAGYRPERHAAMDADAAKIAAAITAVKAALAQQDDPHPPSRHCMCDACKPAFEPTPGPEQEPTRAQQMRDAGYTRRPTLREMTEDEQEPVAWANKDDFGKFDMRVRSNCDYYHTEPLFAAPPRREWQGLTTKEAMFLVDTVPKGVFYGCEAGIGLGIWIAAVEAADKALRSKNNG